LVVGKSQNKVAVNPVVIGNATLYADFLQ